MVNSIFITGTDTGVGKTVVTALLGRLFTEKGVRAITQKWVQTGCDGISGDIAAHMKLIRNGGEYIGKYHSDMAPYVLKFPSSPHLAALLDGKRIDAGKIENAFRRLREDFDFVLVEGTGGIMVPLNDKELIVDIVERLRLDVLVVAENRLGAINQTLLTVEALRKRGLRIAGILFNRICQGGNDLILRDNMKIIGELTGEEVLGELAYNHSGSMETFYRTFLPVGERIFESLAKL